MTLLDQLQDLRATRLAADELEATIKAAEEPLKEQLKALTGDDREVLRVLRESEDALAAAASADYLAAAKARAIAMAAHPDAPPPAIAMPTGCGVKWLSAVEVLDPTLLPRCVLVPDKKLLKDAFGSGAVPGAVLQQHPIFEFRKPKDKEPKRSPKCNSRCATAPQLPSNSKACAPHKQVQKHFY